MPKPDNATDGEVPPAPRSIGRHAGDLGAKPADAAEAQAKLRRVLATADPSNPDHLHLILDVILSLRSLARGDSDGDEAALGREAAALLIRGAMDWTRSARPYLADSVGELEAEPDRWRFEVSLRLEERTDLFPDWLRDKLDAALLELGSGSGEIPPLFAPERKQGRGRYPTIARQFEKEMLRWAFYETGRGATLTNAKEGVAARAGTSVANINKWHDQWRANDKAGLEREIEECRGRGASLQSFDESGRELDFYADGWKAARGFGRPA